MPAANFKTNEQFALWAKATYDALEACNVDKKALRAWADSLKKAEKEVAK